ncbi:MAG TPA: substrate-binding domain-containing protein [Anaerolineales bacterium]|nr:substrate-binding domain-containing protein [Anaerolineales bacterium]
MKRIVVFGFLVVAALAIAACAQAQATPAAGQPAEKITLGMANFSQCCAYFIGMNNAVIDEAKAYPNVDIVSTDADGDAAKFTADIEDLIAKGVDGVVISGAWLEQAPAALESLKAAGIPAVLVDRQWKGDYTSYVGPENFTIGAQDGQYIVDKLGGEGTLVVIKGGPADNSIGLNRTNGMLSIVEKNPGIKVITAPDFGGWSEDGGLTQMENLLAANPNIDAVFCENDSMCLGAQRAIADAGRTNEMFLCGVDGQKEALLQILHGSNYACTGLNNSDQIGRAGFNRVMSILAGAAAEHDSYLPSPLITKDNVQKYYDPNSLF